jgi:hypothetical protein
MAPRAQIVKPEPRTENPSESFKLFNYYLRYNGGLPLTIEEAGGIVGFYITGLKKNLMYLLRYIHIKY